MMVVMYVVWFALGATLVASDLSVGTSHLLLDNSSFEVSNGAFHQTEPTKLGVKLIPEHDWEMALYMYGSIVEVSSTELRLYYTCTGPANLDTTYLAVAISHDRGTTFSKPFLNLVSYDGSTANNLVFAVPFDGWPNSGKAGNRLLACLHYISKRPHVLQCYWTLIHWLPPPSALR
jgi:hypothetical protein